MAAWKSSNTGVTLAIVLILLNIVANMAYTYKYELRIGFLSVNNFFLLQGIIGKPWTHTQCVGQALILAIVYRRILEYRKVTDKFQKAVMFGSIHNIMTSRK